MKKEEEEDIPHLNAFSERTFSMVRKKVTENRTSLHYAKSRDVAKNADTRGVISWCHPL